MTPHHERRFYFLLFFWFGLKPAASVLTSTVLQLLRSPNDMAFSKKHKPHKLELHIRTELRVGFESRIGGRRKEKQDLWWRSATQSQHKFSHRYTPKQKASVGVSESTAADLLSTFPIVGFETARCAVSLAQSPAAPHNSPSLPFLKIVN